jgi:hypothetical protein
LVDSAAAVGTHDRASAAIIDWIKMRNVRFIFPPDAITPRPLGAFPSRAHVR